MTDEYPDTEYQQARNLVQRACQYDPRTSASDKAVFTVIVDHINRKDMTAWPSLKTIAEMAGVSYREAGNAIVRLRGLGYLSWVKRKTPKGKVNEYTIHYVRAVDRFNPLNGKQVWGDTGDLLGASMPFAPAMQWRPDSMQPTAPSDMDSMQPTACDSMQPTACKPSHKNLPKEPSYSSTQTKEQVETAEEGLLNEEEKTVNQKTNSNAGDGGNLHKPERESEDRNRLDDAHLESIALMAAAHGQDPFDTIGQSAWRGLTREEQDALQRRVEQLIRTNS